MPRIVRDFILAGRQVASTRAGFVLCVLCAGVWALAAIVRILGV